MKKYVENLYFDNQLLCQKVSALTAKNDILIEKQSNKRANAKRINGKVNTTCPRCNKFKQDYLQLSRNDATFKSNGNLKNLNTRITKKSRGTKVEGLNEADSHSKEYRQLLEEKQLLQIMTYLEY
ncbi:hypothetical protein RFI_11461 [Reticulomyxa filosa]|uniref:Uncharacterized protein n=1 Tax=Reticulomyxa filosa TaxID=46433 RepID=X6NIV5_RETFI|nr:hypothetical protein RFI_11461 [Reticulomyxa filosa]|eukprot:ETO25674.1 hypothetical protein RFI_11461 [Reticulomyxa filosa]